MKAIIFQKSAPHFTRRHLLQTASATAALAGASFPVQAFAEMALKKGKAQAFSFDALKDTAKKLSGSSYVAPPLIKPDILESIDYDAHGKIRFKPELALFADTDAEHPITFFHLGRYFKKPVRMHVVSKGTAAEILYDPDYFDMPKDSPAHALPENVGFAGFRFQESVKGHLDAKGKPLDWQKNDWVAFLGASYFRAIGSLYQYGLSARALAVDVAVAGKPEEFPDFTHIYFETPAKDASSVTVYALLNSPSVTGAYQFIMQRGEGVIMDVQSIVYVRKDVARLGLAPLTSMFWYSEAVKKTAIDWRPEVHDSDGLLLHTGAGEHIWRPLNNPQHTTASAFVDNNPKGFGLMQRDREVGHYLDGVYYERRPSLWIEPQGAWGAGSVQLIEIPTDDEIHDNIVAMWVPKDPVKAGQSFTLNYKLYWQTDAPYKTPLEQSLGRCVATRLGNGGQPGTMRPQGVRKFMVEFLGDQLKHIPFGAKPEVVLWASRGEFSYIFAEAVPNDVAGHWRAQFDLKVAGNDPVDIRCFLRLKDQVLTETWLYQYSPF
jgi:periplasmic glucans biosynthesis protein